MVFTFQFIFGEQRTRRQIMLIGTYQLYESNFMRVNRDYGFNFHVAAKSYCLRICDLSICKTLN